MATTPSGSAHKPIDLTLDDEDDQPVSPTPKSTIPTAKKHREIQRSREAVRSTVDKDASLPANNDTSRSREPKAPSIARSIPDRSRLSLDADQGLPRKRPKLDADRRATFGEKPPSSAPATTRSLAFDERIRTAAHGQEAAVHEKGRSRVSDQVLHESRELKSSSQQHNLQHSVPKPRSSTQAAVPLAHSDLAARAQTSTPRKPTSSTQEAFVQEPVDRTTTTTPSTHTTRLQSPLARHKSTYDLVESPATGSEQAQASRQLHDETRASEETAGRNLPVNSIEAFDEVQHDSDQPISKTPQGQQQDSELFKTPKLPLELQIETAITRELRSLQDDTAYATKGLLRRARMSVRSNLPKTSAAAENVFASLKPLQWKEVSPKSKVSKGSLMIHTDSWTAGSTKPTRKSFVIPIKEHTLKHDKPLPKYCHVVRLQESVLAPNVPTLNVWPYLGDENTLDDASLRQMYVVDVKDRLNKLVQLHLAQWLFSAAEAALLEVDLAWSDILAFLFSKKQNLPHLTGDDFPAGSQRWLECSKELGTRNNSSSAAQFCDIFLRLTGLSAWQVLRRSRLIRDYFSDPEHITPADLSGRECRVCFRFDCWVHGKIQKHAESDSDSDDSDESMVVANADTTDIINPPRANFRKRIGFVVQDEGGHEDSHRKTVKYWETKDSHGKNYKQPDDMHTFLPCDHPGETCQGAQCSCFESEVPCEKYCSCSSACPRKFQGCNCEHGPKKVCFKDIRCACYVMGRECDADLCGGCGVEQVLDTNKTKDKIAKLCQNASIQRGVPSHTLLGDSPVHELGLYACQDIPKDHFIGEYKGEVLTRREADRRGAIYEHQKLSYLFTLNKTQEVDATYCGNKIRFINHNAGEAMNVYSMILLVNTVHRIGMWATRHISAGEELFFNYGKTFPDVDLGGKARKAVPKARNLATVPDAGPKPKVKPQKRKSKAESEHGSAGHRVATYYVDDSDYAGSSSDLSDE